MTEKQIKPPKLADRFFNWYCRNELAESIQGDLHERFEDHLENYGKKKAKWLYWLAIFRFMNRFTLKATTQKRRRLIPTVMLKNYTIVAFRSIKRSLSFTSINVIGLSISMAVCLLIIVMVDDQVSYDEFHSNREEIYRVYHERINYEVDLPIATTPLPLGTRLKEEFPGINSVVQFRRGLNGEVIDNGKAIQLNGYFTNPAFFDLFDFTLLNGTEETALKDPFSVILRKDIAEKFFRDQDPLGQTLDIEGLGQFTVTGVLDKIPGKTHIDFEALGSFNTVAALENQEKIRKGLNDWGYTSAGWVYFHVSESNRLTDLENYLETISNENYNEDSEYLVDFKVQKMTDITPGPLMGNQIGQAMPNFFVYGLVILGVLIMTCAAFNYANLTTARAMTRFKEVGVRKVMGSSKGQVVLQFIVEAVIVSLISLVIAIALLRLLIPAFEGLGMSTLLNWELEPDLKVYLQFVLFCLFSGLIIGVLPSLYMSAVKPIAALKGIQAPRLSKLGLRKALIIVQLVISVVLVTSSMLVYRQIKFMINKDYGYNKENIVNIDLQGQDLALLKPELEKLAFVSTVSGANNIPNIGRHNDMDVRNLVSDEPISFNYFTVDENYISNLELQLVAGSNFTPNQVEEREVMLNETAAKTLGYELAMDAIGQNIILEDSTNVNIVGVVKDYNFMILYMEISPLMLRNNPGEFEWAQVKVSGQNPINELKQLEEVWAGFDPNHDFEYSYFDEQIKDFYSMFYDVVYIVGLISILSIVIAGLGLLGISTYSIRTRLKEVGIRKILGANGKDLVLLLGKNFLMLITISTVIGSTLAFLGNKAWLDMFAYRIQFGLDIIGIAFLFIAVIGGLTIGTQTWKALGTNPAETLRNE